MLEQTSSTPMQREPPPTRWSGLVFEGKAWALRLARIGREAWSGRPTRHAAGFALRNAPIRAEFEGNLWPKDEADQALVAGKIQNLRLAAKALDGLEMPAGAVFSFWRQLGRASARRGFVAGRELREGCIVPAVGGGLCQLSNAIYDSAVRTGLQVVERHRHSRALPGSLAEQDRDATVFWNYVDLRLSAPFAWRLEVQLDESLLHLRIRAADATQVHDLPIHVAKKAVETGDCSTCETHACHRYTGTRQLSPHRTWLIDEQWPEFMAYVARHRHGGSRVLGVPSEQASTLGWRFSQALAWAHWRLALWRKSPIPQARTERLERIAGAMIRQLRPDDLHLVVSQGLLPYLWRAGELAGRRFDVLMSALPMASIQKQLDAAAALHPDSPTLRDFRAPGWLMDAEAQALAQAHRLISPHEQVLALAGERGERLPWQSAPSTAIKDRSHAVADRKMCLFFPASSLARKGALELRDALRELPVSLLLLGATEDAPEFWRGFDIARVTTIAEGLTTADIVVLPAWVEHQPRGLLAAMDQGVPVIATGACGLPPSRAWQRVAEGDSGGLRKAIEQSRAEWMRTHAHAPVTDPAFPR